MRGGWKSVSGVAGFALLVLGVLALVAALVLPSTHVAAVPVMATARSDLSRIDCYDGHTVDVSFVWNASTTTQSFYSPDCDRGYRRGDTFTIFAASNDPSNLGPTEDWILHPDQHDPFDFIGPNGLRPFLGFAAAGFLIAAAIVLWTTRQRRQHARR